MNRRQSYDDRTCNRARADCGGAGNARMVGRQTQCDWACMLLFGLFLALVMIAGPLLKLP